MKKYSDYCNNQGIFNHRKWRKDGRPRLQLESLPKPSNKILSKISLIILLTWFIIVLWIIISIMN